MIIFIEKFQEGTEAVREKINEQQTLLFKVGGHKAKGLERM